MLTRGGLYEVDLLRRRLKACYWPEDAHRVLRGTWFVEKSPDWVPLKVSSSAWPLGKCSILSDWPGPTVLPARQGSEDLRAVAQEATADELEEAYRSEIWNPSRGRIQAHKLGFQAARVDLRTLTNEAKVASLLVSSHIHLFVWTAWASPNASACRRGGLRCLSAKGGLPVQGRLLLLAVQVSTA